MFGLCPFGRYCPTATALPIVCANGTYTPSMGATSCLPCPQGSYCVSSINEHLACPRGHYCPEGTSYDWKPCPVGRYGGVEGLVEEDDCLPCTEGQYCASPGLSNPTGNCSAGYYCPLGSFTSIGETVYSPYHICPPGSYCPKGSGRPISCPKGTYNPSTGVMSEINCINCLGGQYCLTANLTSPTGVCEEGYYCKSGSDTPRPVEEYSDSSSGRILGGLRCDKGTYCPFGTTLPLGIRLSVKNIFEYLFAGII